MRETTSKQFALRMDYPTHRWLSLMARVKGVSMNEIVLGLIKQENERVNAEEPELVKEIRALVREETSLTESAVGIKKRRK